MPIRPREINDRITESRLRQVMRHLLNQEVRRLLADNAALQVQVTTNTGNIAANASNISANTISIDLLDRRALERNVQGAIPWPPSAAGGGGVTDTPTAFVGQQVWSISLADQPIQTTTWEVVSFTSDGQFDTFQFDTEEFDAATFIQGIVYTPTVTYIPATNVYGIDWGTAKSGTLHLLNFDSGTAYAVVAVAD
jgi:hypothetical protein